MALVPRMSSFYTPSRSTYRDDLTPLFSLFNGTFNELQRLSDNLPISGSNDSTHGFFVPKFDVKETTSSYELQGELPGITQENISIEFSDENILTVKGRAEHRHERGTMPDTATSKQIQGITEQKEQLALSGKTGPDSNATESKQIATAQSSGKTTLSTQESPQHTYWVSERSVGEFSRSFSFPNDVDQDAVKASLKNGVLGIVVPKRAKEHATRRIVVESE